MQTQKKIEKIIGLTLVFGIVISSLFVFIGGTLFLFQSDNESLKNELIISANYHISIKEIWQNLLIFSPIGLIELGLYLLVMVQVFRVIMLVLFYVFRRDYWFFFLSSFVLLVLIYSLFIRT